MVRKEQLLTCNYLIPVPWILIFNSFTGYIFSDSPILLDAI